MVLGVCGIGGASSNISMGFPIVFHIGEYSVYIHKVYIAIVYFVANIKR